MSRPLGKLTGYDRERRRSSRKGRSKQKRSTSYMILISLTVLSTIGVVMVGGLSALPRYFLALGAAAFVMVLVLAIKWDWLMGFAGIVTFILVARFVPQTFVPLAPLSIVDMIYAPPSFNTVTLGVFVLLGFVAAMAYVWSSRRD